MSQDGGIGDVTEFHHSIPIFNIWAIRKFSVKVYWEFTILLENLLNCNTIGCQNFLAPLPARTSRNKWTQPNQRKFVKNWFESLRFVKNLIQFSCFIFWIFKASRKSSSGRNWDVAQFQVEILNSNNKNFVPLFASRSEFVAYKLKKISNLKHSVHSCGVTVVHWPILVNDGQIVHF